MGSRSNYAKVGHYPVRGFRIIVNLPKKSASLASGYPMCKCAYKKNYKIMNP